MGWFAVSSKVLYSHTVRFLSGAALLGCVPAFADPIFYGTESNVDWSSLGTIDYDNLDACFRGNVSCDATTDGRWRAYPQRSNGMLTGDMYNGCYRYQGRALNRYSDLNSSGGCTCPNGALDCSKESLVRVFVGYQTFCPVGSPNPCPTGGEVRVNCSIQTFSIGEGATQIGSYNQNCIEGRPLRLSRATTVVSTTPSPGCPAGQGLDGGGCVPCPSGTYKEFAGDFACSPCPFAGVLNATSMTYSTTSTGATLATACSVAYTCPSGFTQGTHPTAYTSPVGYTGAYCLAPAPTPSPSPIPACTTCPAGSTALGNVCVTSGTNFPARTMYKYRCIGAGGCVSLPCLIDCESGSPMGQVSSSDPISRTCDGGHLWTSYGGSCVLAPSPPNPFIIPAIVNGCSSGFVYDSTLGTCAKACP